MSDAIKQKHAFAMGQTTPGYGHYVDHMAKGGHSMARNRKVPTAGHHNMDGGIGHGTHHHNHKSHGHTEGVVHQKTGGVGEGGTVGGPSQSGEHGPSDNQFGGKMPSGNGSSLGRW